MKIFITGSTGFLGKSICEQLPYIFKKYKRGSNIKEDLDGFNPDVIIHSAAEIYNEIEMYSSNILLTRQILSWVKSKDVKMVYFGSSSEYGHTNKPMSETDVCIPTSFYGLTKLISTQECINTADKYDCNITVVRPFSVYGKNEPERRLIPTLRRNITNNLPVTLIKGVHDFIHINDFVHLIDIIIRCDDTSKTRGQIFNAGTGISHSNKDIYHIMKTFINPYHENVEYIDEFKKCDSPFWVCDNTKSKSVLNFESTITVEKGIFDYIYNYEHAS